MQLKFLKQIVEDVAGASAGKIVDLLANKKDVNEFIIAKKLGLTINQTRNLLYRLSHMGILSSTRKKDKRKGWYIYFWTLNVLRSLEILENKLQEEISKLEIELKEKQSKRFYKCKICGVEVGEENALLHDFTCPECGEVYELSDTAQHIESTKKEIVKLKKDLALISEERKGEQMKKEKKLVRQIKKVEKEKRERRRKKAKARARAKKREAKAKKKTKKKPKVKKAKQTKKKKPSKKKKQPKKSKKKKK